MIKRNTIPPPIHLFEVIIVVIFAVAISSYVQSSIHLSIHSLTHSLNNIIKLAFGWWLLMKILNAKIQKRQLSTIDDCIDGLDDVVSEPVSVSTYLSFFPHHRLLLHLLLFQIVCATTDER